MARSTLTSPRASASSPASGDEGATVTLASQADRTVLTGHTLTATLGGTGDAVAWTSSTGSFSDSTSLTPTYTPTTIGHQEVTCTPSIGGITGAPAVESWDVTRPLPVVASTLGDLAATAAGNYSPTLSDSGGADGPLTWSTSAVRLSDGAAVTVTASTTTTPTMAYSLGESYRVTSTATDAYGRVASLSRAVHAHLDLPAGTIGADSEQSTLGAITLDGSGVTGATTYLWSVAVVEEPGTVGYTSAATIASPTSQSTTLTPDGPGTYSFSLAAQNASGTTTLERVVVVSRPRPVAVNSLGSVASQTAGTYAPTLSDSAGADGVTWLSSATRIDTGASVSVTAPTTTTPTLAYVVGIAYEFVAVATDSYGRTGSDVASVDARVTDPLPVAANATNSTTLTSLALQTEALSDTAGATGVTWSTTVERYTISGTLEGTETVTGSTTTGPTWTPSALNRVYLVKSVATDTYTRTSLAARTTSTRQAQVTATITGAPAEQSSPAGVVLGVTLSAGTASTYSWQSRVASGGAGGAWGTTGYSDASSATPTYTPPAYDAYELRCVVTLTTTETVEARSAVTVSPPSIVFTAPAAQTSTTAGAASITFSAASGGAGGFSYSGATLAKPAGSAATLSGSGLGAYTFTTDVPGTYSVTLTATDANGLTAQTQGTVTYSPVGPTWTTLFDEDFSTCDTYNQQTTGAFAITRAAAPVVTLTAYTSGTVTGTQNYDVINGTGLRITQPGGTGEMHLRGTTPAFSATTRIAIQVLAPAQVFSGAADAKMVIRLTDGTTWNVADGVKSLLMHRSKPANYRATTNYYVGATTSPTIVYNDAADLSASNCYTIIMDGQQAYYYVHSGVSDFQPMDSLESGSPIVSVFSLAQNPSSAYVRALAPTYYGIAHLDAAGAVTIKKLRILEAARN